MCFSPKFKEWIKSKTQGQNVGTTQMSTDRWINKMWYVYMYIKWILFILKKGVLACATMWLSLEDTMLNEISQIKIDQFCRIPLKWGTQMSQSHRDRVEDGGCWGLEGRLGRCSLMGVQCQFGDGWWRMATELESAQCHRTIPSKMAQMVNFMLFCHSKNWKRKHDIQMPRWKAEARSSGGATWLVAGLQVGDFQAASVPPCAPTSTKHPPLSWIGGFPIKTFWACDILFIEYTNGGEISGSRWYTQWEVLYRD